MSSPNREYKSSVFTDLFSDEATVLELYNALTGSRYTVDDGLRFTTLTDALFMERLNDISFTIGDKLVVLVEHQSTINENMPLRALIYIGRVYEKIIEERAIYRSKLLKIPTPEFYVLYNGVADYPDEKTLRLADAFSYIPGDEKSPMLDLSVRVLNINKGHNENILAGSEVLGNYAAFVEQVHNRRQAGLPLKSAVTSAIDFCVANGILVDYLKRNASEVRNMIFTEFKMDVAQEVWLEEGREEGREEKCLEIARTMFADGDSIEKIARTTGYPLETLKEKLFVQ